MRRFRFALEPALRLRRRREEQAQVALAEQRRLLEREEAQLRQVRDDLQRQGIALYEGLELTLWNDDAGEVDAVARYDPEWGGYFAELRR